MLCSSSYFSRTVGREVNINEMKILFFFRTQALPCRDIKNLLAQVRQLKHILFCSKLSNVRFSNVNFSVFPDLFLLTFNFCFIHLIRNLTVIYSLSDIVKLGRPLYATVHLTGTIHRSLRRGVGHCFKGLS